MSARSWSSCSWLVTYRLFGVFANVAVAINVAMIFGVLSLLNATLTLPGHRRHRADRRPSRVDSNVLIYERIREELRGGRNAISAIDAGFQAGRLSTILDFQHHHLHRRCGAVLYRDRAGARLLPWTLGIGIITTVFHRVLR